MTSRKQRIEKLLIDHFKPSMIDIEDESRKHHVPEGAETHYKLTLVCSDFMGVSLVNRHRKINQLLSSERENGLHALSMHLFTPEEWATRESPVQPSPACRDGFE